jgi:TetR/AcrR family transcriptional regulator, ethionamide resistance regulator
MASTRSLRRQRRTPIDADDPTRAALLESTERLLRERPLAQLTVDQISRGASLTRTAFYRYFGRKEDAVVALSARYFDIIFEGRKPFFSEDRPLDEACREAVANELATWSEHGAVLRGLADLGASDPEMREAWYEQVEQFVPPVEQRIRSHARQRGVEPPPQPRQVAEALVWMAERYYYVWSSHYRHPTDDVVEAMTGVMVAMMEGPEPAAAVPAQPSGA